MAKGSVYEGKSLDEAVRKGLEDLGLSRPEAMITVVEEGKGGFLGFGARPFRVSIARRPGGAMREPEETREHRVSSRREERRGGRGRDRDRNGGGAGRRDGRKGEAAPRAEGARAEGPRAAEPRGESRGEPRGEGRGERRSARGEGRGERREEGREEVRGERRDEARTERRPEGRPEGREERRPRPITPPAGGAAPVQQPAAAGAPQPGAVGDEAGDELRRRRRRGRRGGRGRRRAGLPGSELPADATNGASVGQPGLVHEEFEDDAMDDAMNDTPLAAPAPVSAAPPAESAPPSYPREDRNEHAYSAPRSVAVAEPLTERTMAPAAHVQEDSPTMSPDELASTSKRITEDLLKAMGFEAKVSVTTEGNRVDVTAEVGQHDELLTGHKGEVRQAIQHLLNRFLNRGEGSRYHLQLEVNDFWKRREVELEALARTLADQAVTGRAEMVTEYLNSQERRIIHVTLREDTRVRTYALGTGMIKRVAVAPADFPERTGEDDPD